MKKYSLIVPLFCIFISCSKSEISSTSEALKSADSLINQANESIKTFDSITEIVNDSSALNTEIRKHTERVEDLLNGTNLEVDSVQAIIKKAQKTLDKNSEIVKTMDSAAKALEGGKNPMEVLSGISKTLEKATNSPSNQTGEPPVMQDPTDDPSKIQVYTEPIKKHARLTFDVQDLGLSSAKIRQIISQYNGRISRESLTEEEGVKQQQFTVQIPLKDFDRVLNDVSKESQSITEQIMNSTGTDYQPEQMCEVELTLKQGNTAMLSPSNNTTTGTTEEPAGFFNSIKKFIYLVFGFLGILIFGLIFLLVWLFRKLSKKDNEGIAFEHPNEKSAKQEPVQKTTLSGENQSEKDELSSPPPAEDEDPEDPYAKYKPKT